MTHILLIDTSGKKSSIGLSSNGLLVNKTENLDTKNQASVINGMIENVCADSGIQLTDIDAIAVCSGPGSYTGLRIGMASAKGIAYALNTHLLLDNKLALLAYQQIQKHTNFLHHGILITAREGEYFFAVYDQSMNEIISPIHKDELAIRDFVDKNVDSKIIFSGDENCIQTFGSDVLEVSEIDLTFWADYAYQNFKKQGFANVASSEPFYMKDVFIMQKKSAL
jgi:tRNA threonylcarbamoyladenosine biosynthesis protein TsaB